ncbi:MAG: thiamine phosphate synthase [Coriobacteriia bacterium]|nr:thiamine phosphate synthase [Coriobacteriia bacterium]
MQQTTSSLWPQGSRDRSRPLPLLCVTNRTLCPNGLVEQLKRVAAMQPAGILLREKDLPESEYADLARSVAPICHDAHIPLVVHTHANVARELGCCHLHLTLPTLEAMESGMRERLAEEFVLSTSCHSVEDAQCAQRLGCACIIAGHIYETGSKPGLEPRGLAFLQAVCAAVEIPVWAIGGITTSRLAAVQESGAAGACMLSGFMRA